MSPPELDLIRIMDDHQIATEYARLASESKDVSDEAIHQSLCGKGVPSEIATQAVQLIPIAFGRHFLNGMGTSFPDKFWIFDSIGKVLQTGSLSENPIYSAAVNLAPTLLTKSVSETVAFRSAEISSVNQALNAGSDPKSLALSPIALFDGAPGAIGIQRAQETIRAHLQELYKPKEPERKPWWRFW